MNGMLLSFLRSHTRTIAKKSKAERTNAFRPCQQKGRTGGCLAVARCAKQNGPLLAAAAPAIDYYYHYCYQQQYQLVY